MIGYHTSTFAPKLKDTRYGKRQVNFIDRVGQVTPNGNYRVTSLEFRGVSGSLWGYCCAKCGAVPRKPKTMEPSRGTWDQVCKRKACPCAESQAAE